jgi:hypothetical protein
MSLIELTKYVCAMQGKMKVQKNIPKYMRKPLGNSHLNGEKVNLNSVDRSSDDSLLNIPSIVVNNFDRPSNLDTSGWENNSDSLNNFNGSNNHFLKLQSNKLSGANKS